MVNKKTLLVKFIKRDNTNANMYVRCEDKNILNYIFKNGSIVYRWPTKKIIQLQENEDYMVEFNAGDRRNHVITISGVKIYKETRINWEEIEE